MIERDSKKMKKKKFFFLAYVKSTNVYYRDTKLQISSQLQPIVRPTGEHGSPLRIWFRP